MVGVGLGVMAGERKGKGIVVENAGEGHVWKRRAIASWDAGQPRQRDSTSNISATTNLVTLWPSLINFFIFYLLILFFATPHQGTTSAQGALFLQTHQPLTAPVPPSPLSASCPPCGLSWRISQHLHRKTMSGLLPQYLAPLTIVAEMTVQNRRKHQRFIQQRIDTLLVGLNPYNTVLRERSRP